MTVSPRWVKYAFSARRSSTAGAAPRTASACSTSGFTERPPLGGATSSAIVGSESVETLPPSATPSALIATRVPPTSNAAVGGRSSTTIRIACGKLGYALTALTCGKRATAASSFASSGASVLMPRAASRSAPSIAFAC